MCRRRCHFCTVVVQPFEPFVKWILSNSFALLDIRQQQVMHCDEVVMKSRRVLEAFCSHLTLRLIAAINWGSIALVLQ